MDTICLILFVIVMWLASALITLYLHAKDTWTDHDHVVIATVFGPLSFLIMLYGPVERLVIRLLIPVVALWSRIVARVRSVL